MRCRRHGSIRANPLPGEIRSLCDDLFEKRDCARIVARVDGGVRFFERLPHRIGSG